MKGRGKTTRTEPSYKIHVEQPEESPNQDSKETETKLSPSSKWHDKCIATYDYDKKKKTKKKPAKKYPDEVVRFVEGTPDIESPGDPKRKNPKYNTEIKILEHKYIQCNIVTTTEEEKAALPEEIKPLLINVTFLLHELKQRREPKNEELCAAISKIATLLTELTRRPIKKVDEDETQKPFDEIAGKLAAMLKEHAGPNDERYHKLVQEIERLEQELVQKDSEVNYVKEQILEERARLMPSGNSLDDLLRNSILKNQSLRAEIKFNKAQFRKYTKIMAEKEQMRQKSLLELNNLRRKCAKLEQSVERVAKPIHAKPTNDTGVYHGGSVTKYIKSKVVKDKEKKKVVKPKGKLLKPTAK